MQNQNFFQRNLGWIIPVGILVLLALWGIGAYNMFVTQNEQITSQWAQVENQYQRRFDLIPNVVETVKGVAKQEQTVFGDIATARTHYAGARTQDQKVAASNEVESALGRLLVISENYPVLQSAQSFRDLTTELEGTENRISTERMKYNDIVRVFNISIQHFPTSLIARIGGFSQHEYFTAPPAAQVVPKVSF